MWQDWWIDNATDKSPLGRGILFPAANPLRVNLQAMRETMTTIWFWPCHCHPLCADSHSVCVCVCGHAHLDTKLAQTGSWLPKQLPTNCFFICHDPMKREGKMRWLNGDDNPFEITVRSGFYFATGLMEILKEAVMFFPTSTSILSHG